MITLYAKNIPGFIASCGKILYVFYVNIKFRKMLVHLVLSSLLRRGKLALALKKDGNTHFLEQKSKAKSTVQLIFVMSLRGLVELAEHTFLYNNK